MNYKFGKIDYLNLLPFDVFIKRYPLPSQFKAMIAYRKSYPAKLNQDFLFGRIDMGFVSSIMAYQDRKIIQSAGIVSKGEVWSVLALPNQNKKDYQSATSNALIEVLGIKGEVLIGDRALGYKLGGGEAKDLGLLWWEKTHLPCVFGIFGARVGRELAQKISNHFSKSKIKIPYYLLQQRSFQTQIPAKSILEYLQKIHYKIGEKEKQGLRYFHRQLLFLGIKRPKRFN